MIRIIHISDLHYQTNYNKLNCFYKEFMPQLLSPFVIIDELLKEYDKNVDLLIVSGDLCEKYQHIYSPYSSDFGSENIPK